MPVRHHPAGPGDRSRPFGLIALLVAMILGLSQVALLAPEARAASCTGGILNVSAHEDDDLLFMSPDLLTDISAGRCVRTLYVTAGDADSNTDYWTGREEGIEDAYAKMAGVSNAWTTSSLTAAGASLRVRTLTGANVSVVFMRLPDGMPLGGGTQSQGYQSLKKLLDGQIGTIRAVDGSATYTASSLRNAVLDVMRATNAASVRTQDYAHGYGFTGGGWTDHYDHLAGAYVAKDASDAYAAAHRITAYMGYPVSGEPVNVSGSTLTTKTSVFSTYAQHDPFVYVPDYAGRGWINHQVVVASGGASVVANAGADQTSSVGFPVTLDASGSTASGSMGYAWAQTSGPAVSLSGANTARATFTPQTAGSYTFRVTVTSGSASSTDSVNVSVNSDSSGNVARLPGVTVTASSQAAGQGAANVVDGVISGYPADYTKEWATVGGKAGSWVKLSFPQPVFIDRAVLYDRPNADDQVLGGVITFPDGSTAPVGALGNTDGGTTVNFAPRAVTSLTFTITNVSATTTNVGLAELQVYGSVDKAPTANAGPDQQVQLPATVTLDGSASSDPDAGTTLGYTWTQQSGPAAALSSTTASKPTFTPTAAGTYVFSLVVSDGALSSPASTVKVTVGANHPPVADAGHDQVVAVGTVVTLTGSGSDPDPGTTLTYQWAKTSGPAATLSNPTVAAPTFTAATAGTYVFTLTVSDSLATASASVTITVLGVPVANAGPDRYVLTGAQATLDGSASTNPNPATTLTYAWSQVSGPGVTLSDPAAAKPTFVPTATATYTFELKVSVNGVVTSTPDSVTFTVVDVLPPNQPPTADAGPDQSVVAGSLVTLHGSGTDPDPGTTLSYQWSQTSGPSATLSSNSTAAPTFIPAGAGSYVFSLVVSDGEATSPPDTVTITVRALPVADAGPDQSVTAGDLVNLKGSGTSPDPAATLTYQWSQTSGPSAALSSNTTAAPTFTPAGAGSYVFSLVVSDGTATSQPDTVTIAVAAPPLLPPTADAGPDLSATTSATIRLDGSASVNPNPGTPMSYQWAKTSGPAAALSDPASATPTFTPTAAGTYVFDLTVTVGTLTSVDTVNVVVTAAVDTNLARASGVSVTASSQNTATGQTAAKAVDGSPTGYPTDATKEWATAGGKAGSWIQLTWAAPVTLSRVVLYDRPNTDDQVTAGTLLFSDGTTVPVTALANSGAATTFTFTARSVTSVRLRIDTVAATTTNVGLAEFEAWGYSGGSTVNRAPTAKAGSAQSVTAGTPVTLDGSASSDPDPGTVLTYAWTAKSGPATSLSGANTARPTFTPSTAGTYVFTLVVSDGFLSSSDTVSVAVTPAPNRPPKAVVANQSALVNTSVTLDGTQSSDPDGDTIGYQWTQKSGPAVTLAAPTSARPTFTPTTAGTYVFTLTVKDPAGLTSSADATVTVTSAPPTLTNLARASGVSVTASSQNTATGQTAAKAVDGSPTGYPTDATKEWATAGGKAGSWIQLTWSAPVTLSKVVLYDRPNTDDRITAGTLLFSDGTTVPVTALTNSGAATTFTFTARTVTSVRLRIDTVATTTTNVGLAEFEAWGTAS